MKIVCKEETCQKKFEHIGKGRKPDYCSNACRQKDYRRRQKVQLMALAASKPAEDLGGSLGHIKQFLKGLSKLDPETKANVMKLAVMNFMQTIPDQDAEKVLEIVHDQVYLEAARREIKVCSVS